MERYKNVYVLGTSHVSRKSVQEVENVIKKIRPAIVAVELDSMRYASLMSKKKQKMSTKRAIKEWGIKGYLFNRVGAWAEERLGKIVATPPGSEMKKAIETAQSMKIPVICIDQDINITLRKLSARLTWGEKMRFLKEILLGFLISGKKQKEELKRVPSKTLVKEVIEKVKRDFPSIYRTVITERDEIMAQKVRSLAEKREGPIVAIVGAGHERGIMKKLRVEKR